LDHFEEDTPDEEVRRHITRYVNVAVTYVRGEMAAERVGRSRAPVVTVPTDGRQVTLRLSLLAGFKAARTPLH
jgi:hypothetical protein